jgi:hypothetical protein
MWKTMEKRGDDTATGRKLESGCLALAIATLMPELGTMPRMKTTDLTVNRNPTQGRYEQSLATWGNSREGRSE